ncbi:MAG: serine/threonine-protein kinase [Candidatus Sericytochromatia bacterium]
MGLLTDNYHIIKEIGHGGMGTVYLANDKRLDRKVAIKMLKISGTFTLEQKSEIISRFQKEARAIAKLSHPNIVNIHDIGEEDEQYYMVMEFLEGKSIANILEEQKILPIDQCVDISIQICRALDYIHKNFIVHRDIKPDNIILINDKIAKITDFGIAQNDSEQLRLTQDGAILGSVMYISPEQLRSSKDVDNRTDIFSYGVTLYQMLTGVLPFYGETVGEVVSKVLSENPDLPRKINPSIPPELEAIVMRAINKDREKRYKTMEDMERDLQNLIATTSLKKTTTINTNQNINKNVLNSKPNNPVSSKPTPVIVEKASNETKLLRLLSKIIISIILVHLSYSFISNLISSSVANELIQTKISGAMIQGPYSQSVVEKAVAFKSALYSLIIVLLMLIFSAYSFPINSKGLHRNFSIKDEIFPLIITLILTSIYTFGFIAKTDTNKAYINAYNEDLNKDINDIDTILVQKGIINYSQIDNYKKKYRVLVSSSERQGRYDKPEVQIKNIVSLSDHILLKSESFNKLSDPTFQILDDLLDNIFAINEPIKELYEPKINQILNTISNGSLSLLPPEAKREISKDSLNKVVSVKFDWDKNNLTLNHNQIKLKYNDIDYLYPQSTDKIVKFSINNKTDKKLFALLYNSNSDIKDKMIISPKESKDIEVREKTEYSLILLSSDKTAVPMFNQFIFNEGDKINIDKIYYQVDDYYSLKEKDFSTKTDFTVKKLDLKANNIFATDDADISLYNLNSFKK